MMSVRRVVGIALVLATGVLAGCVYDPYTGTYVPCCGTYGYPYYGYPSYRYPSPYYYGPQTPAYQTQPYQTQPYQNQTQPYQTPSYQTPPYQTAPPPGQPGAYPPSPPESEPLPPPRPGAAAYPPGPPGGLRQRFAVANVTHDGRLTREQAQADMPMVARHFAAIDVDHKGYVTLPEIREFAAQRRAERQEQGQRAVQ